MPARRRSESVLSALGVSPADERRYQQVLPLSGTPVAGVAAALGVAADEVSRELGGLIRHGITVNAFAPGVVDTGMWDGLNADLREIHGESAGADPMREFAGGTLVGRPASPEELAPFLVYLASPESDYMTGQMYMVDGGQVLV